MNQVWIYGDSIMMKTNQQVKQENKKSIQINKMLI